MMNILEILKKLNVLRKISNPNNCTLLCDGEVLKDDSEVSE